jgi:nucleotide sugar dehydrogenase
VFKIKDYKIGVIGLGYVGLPLAVEFGKLTKVIGYDKNSKRISSLKRFKDKNKELSKKEIIRSKYLKFTDNFENLREANFYIITVPTPINNLKKPDLSLLNEAFRIVSEVIKKKDIVVLESTVYPGATEEISKNIIEKNTNLIFNKDFFLGYSPERINPGDKKHQLKNITKIVSGSNNRVKKIIKNVYGKIIKKIHVSKKIIEAEAAKIIENTQRDINIALMNEFSIILNKMNINTREVLKAANTKWNFNNYVPGLVGGHCISVDPYYLAHKSQQLGYKPNVILSGRKINDQMHVNIYKRIKEIFKKKKMNTRISSLLVLGVTFKENCSDVRNSKVIDLYKVLIKNFKEVKIYDPVVDILDVKNEYGINIYNKFPNKNFDCYLFAVKHKEFNLKFLKKKITNFEKKILFDVKDLIETKYLSGNL